MPVTSQKDLHLNKFIVVYELEQKLNIFFERNYVFANNDQKVINCSKHGVNNVPSA